MIFLHYSNNSEDFIYVFVLSVCLLVVCLLFMKQEMQM